MQRIALALLAGAALLAAVLVTRALVVPAPQAPPEPAAAEASGFDDTALAQRLAAAVRLPTISYHDASQTDPRPFQELRTLLERSYPRVFAAGSPETVGAHGLLLTLAGSDASLQPLVLLAHQDVVPVSPGTEGDWAHPAFAGVIDGGYVWGRGTIDDKSSLVGLVEASEALLAQGFAPRRTVHLAFGHDEEVGGRDGAQRIAALLAGRGVQAEMVLDEGGVVSQGVLDGVSRPVAMIGIAEKGYLSVRLAVATAPGHSSTPPRATAIGKLTRAVQAIEAAPMGARMEGPVLRTLEAVAPYMSFERRLAIANLWLFKPVLRRILEGSDSGRASLRTTVAPTILAAGDKDNVLPGRATAVLNLRLLPGDSAADALAHLTRAVADPDVTVEALPGHTEASPVSDPDAPQFAALARSIRAAMPDVIAAPYLTIGGTDAAHYAGVSRNVYRFLPARFAPDDMARFHGTNERISVKNYGEMVRFYAQLLRDLAG